MSDLLQVPPRTDRRVYVGCAFPSITIYPRRKGDRKGKHQATCSCGWEGPRRRKLDQAVADRADHLATTTQPKTFPRLAALAFGDHVTERIEATNV